jgi:hypothetical protein
MQPEDGEIGREESFVVVVWVVKVPKADEPANHRLMQLWAPIFYWMAP